LIITLKKASLTVKKNLMRKTFFGRHLQIEEGISTNLVVELPHNAKSSRLKLNSSEFAFTAVTYNFNEA